MAGPPPAATVSSLLAAHAGKPRWLATGCAIDELGRGLGEPEAFGVPLHGITEVRGLVAVGQRGLNVHRPARNCAQIAGEASAGKTQLCLSLAARVSDRVCGWTALGARLAAARAQNTAFDTALGRNLFRARAAVPVMHSVASVVPMIRFRSGRD